MFCLPIARPVCVPWVRVLCVLSLSCAWSRRQGASLHFEGFQSAPNPHQKTNGTLPLPWKGRAVTLGMRCSRHPHPHLPSQARCDSPTFLILRCPQLMSGFHPREPSLGKSDLQSEGWPPEDVPFQPAAPWRGAHCRVGFACRWGCGVGLWQAWEVRGRERGVAS